MSAQIWACAAKETKASTARMTSMGAGQTTHVDNPDICRRKGGVTSLRLSKTDDKGAGSRRLGLAAQKCAPCVSVSTETGTRSLKSPPRDLGNPSKPMKGVPRQIEAGIDEHLSRLSENGILLTRVCAPSQLGVLSRPNGFYRHSNARPRSVTGHTQKRPHLKRRLGGP